MRQITYAWDTVACVWISRLGNELAWPVLQFDQLGKNGDFTAPAVYALNKISVFHVHQPWDSLRWTKHVPLTVKNEHRKFWGFPLLPVPKFKVGSRVRLARSIDCRRTGGPLMRRGEKGNALRCNRDGGIWVSLETIGKRRFLRDDLKLL